MKNHRLILDKRPGFEGTFTISRRWVGMIEPEVPGGLEILIEGGALGNDWLDPAKNEPRPVLVTIPSSVMLDLAQRARRNRSKKSVLGGGDGDGITAKVQL